MYNLKLITITLLLSILFSNNSCAQGPLDVGKKYKTASDFFQIPKTKVLVVGTFHFDYPNLDAIKTEEKDKIDVLSESRQKEMEELIKYLKKFSPNKIGIEALSNRFTQDLKKYKNGDFDLSRDERHQLGVRLAHELNLDTLFAVDAESLAYDLNKTNPDLVDAMWKDYDWMSEELVDSLKVEWYTYANELLKEVSLLEYLKYMNSPEFHQFDYGCYLIGDFRLGETQGPDVLGSYWYNRNLRIFRKVQELTENSEDRILLILGNGHASLMRQFLKYSPEYEFVEFGSL